MATNNEFPHPFSLDVVSLYTSIPIQEAIKNIVERLKTNTTYCSLTTDDIKNLLTVVLQNTYFTFQSNIYLQHEGRPMGSSLSGLLAIVFMDTIERKALTGCQPIAPRDQRQGSMRNLLNKGAVYMIPLCQDEIWGGMISIYWNKSRCMIQQKTSFSRDGL